MKAGSGYLTIQSSGTTNRTLTLPDTNGALLANTSALDASKLTGEVPAANLPASVGATVELDGDEVVGVLPWSKVGTVGRPTTVDGYGITNAVKVDSQGYVVGTLRVQQAGDIQMFSP